MEELSSNKRISYSALERDFEIAFFDERDSETRKLPLSILLIYENGESIGAIRYILSSESEIAFYVKEERAASPNELNDFALQQFKSRNRILDIIYQNDPDFIYDEVLTIS